MENVFEYKGAKYVLRETSEPNTACRSCAFGEREYRKGVIVDRCAARDDDTVSCIREAMRQDVTPSRAYFVRIDD